MKITYDIEGEISLLGTCIISRDRMTEACQSLTTDMFYCPINKEVFRSVLEIYSEGGEVNLDTIASKLKINDLLEKTAPVLAQLRPLASKGSFKSHLKNIQKNYRKARIAHLVKKLSDTYEEKEIDDIQSECDAFFNNSSQVETFSLEDVADREFFDFPNFEEWTTVGHENFKRGERVVGHSTGFPRLDNLIGGLNPTHYVIVAGIPGSGKTTFALQIMKNLMENGVMCGFISLEMVKEQAFLKLISADTGIPFKKLFERSFDDNQKYDVLASYHKLKSNPNLVIQDARLDNIMSLRTRIKQLVHVYGVKVLVIDYITLIKNAAKSNPVEQIQEVSHEIRSLLKELRITGIIISQLNRQSAQNEKPPEAHHLYGSGQLEKDAFEILMLHPEEFGNGRHLWIRKSRFGEQHGVVRYDFDNGIFKEEPCY